ncbi:hypothetical protein D3C75_1202690 [compost metagenome]
MFFGKSNQLARNPLALHLRMNCQPVHNQVRPLPLSPVNGIVLLRLFLVQHNNAGDTSLLFVDI